MVQLRSVLQRMWLRRFWRRSSAILSTQVYSVIGVRGTHLLRFDLTRSKTTKEKITSASVASKLRVASPTVSTLPNRGMHSVAAAWSSLTCSKIFVHCPAVCFLLAPYDLMCGTPIIVPYKQKAFSHLMYIIEKKKHNFI